MNKNIAGLKPEIVWKYFAEICEIPHPSHHEDKIREYLVWHAGNLGLNCHTDNAGNVIIRKPATPGMEDRKGVILQAHADMVPQKNSDKKFDFKKDPIVAYIDGDWVKADGTTLGADNGLGVAAILAVLESKDIVHGPLEALITSTEETGLIGASELQEGVLNGRILINLDSETEGELCIGCAGGLDANMEFDYIPEPIPEGFKSFSIHVKGLLGGHSGTEIILERGNANKILCRFLKSAAAKFGLRIMSIDGGSLRNAIPREAHALAAVPADREVEYMAFAQEFEQTVKTELQGVDDGFSLKNAPSAAHGSVMDTGTQSRFLRAVQVCPNGVMRMSPSMKGIVQTSNNLARIVAYDGKASLQCLMRSASNSEKEYLGDAVSSLFALAGAKTELTGEYDGWNPNPSSPILETMKSVYKELFGHEPVVAAVHAGLECGIIGSKYPGLDMISFGPTICFPHSPDEKVSISSVERFWRYLLATLAAIPAVSDKK